MADTTTVFIYLILMFWSGMLQLIFVAIFMQD